MFGVHFGVRYASRSRNFQDPKLQGRGFRLNQDQLARLHAARALTVKRRVEISSGRVGVEMDGLAEEMAAESGGAAR